MLLITEVCVAVSMLSDVADAALAALHYVKGRGNLTLVSKSPIRTVIRGVKQQQHL